MTPEEAQQAQTIAEDRKKRDAESWENYLHEQSRSYPEDLLDIDHGAYRNACSTCGKPFQGFKRRFTCRVCDIANLKVIVDSQAQKIAEQAKELDSAKSLAGIATNRFFEAKHGAEKYRNAYVDANARRDGHHPKSMIQAELLPWEKWDAIAKCIIDLTETTDSKEVAR